MVFTVRSRQIDLISDSPALVILDKVPVPALVMMGCA